MRPEYLAVWNEPQNKWAREGIMTTLHDGYTVRLALQPGDATRYYVSITPIGMTVDYEVSSEGRNPVVGGSVDRPFGVIVTLLNEGFATRSAHFWAHEFNALDEDQVRDRLGTRTIATAMAIVGLLRVIATGGVGTITVTDDEEE